MIFSILRTKLDTALIETFSLTSIDVHIYFRINIFFDDRLSFAYIDIQI